MNDPRDDKARYVREARVRHEAEERQARVPQGGSPYSASHSIWKWFGVRQSENYVQQFSERPQLDRQLGEFIRLAVQQEMMAERLKEGPKGPVYPLGSSLKSSDLLATTAVSAPWSTDWGAKVVTGAAAPFNVIPVVTPELRKAKEGIIPTEMPAQVPSELIRQWEIQNAAVERAQHSPLRGWVVEAWSYAIVLAIILNGIGWLFSGSLGLLEPIVFVCAAGGIVGTVLAILRSVQEQQNGDHPSNYYERRVIR
jgi:hypothetical protein